MRVRQLAMRLSSLQPHPGSIHISSPIRPKVTLRQDGFIPLLWVMSSISRIADVCSGNGVLGVAAGLLGASEVTFHELDPPTSAIAQANALDVLGASDASPHWEMRHRTRQRQPTSRVSKP